MENKPFTYNYSAVRNKEVENIRRKYLPEEKSKLETLKRLDCKVQSAGMIESLCFGIIGALVFGVGTVLISSHLLGELEKIATHYGIIRQGKMIMEMSAEEMDSRAQMFISIKTAEMQKAWLLLTKKYADVRMEDGYIRIYDVDDVEEIVSYLMENGHVVSEVRKNKIGLEEYYIELMSKQGGKR